MFRPPFEVIGIPMPQPGFHVVEAESPRLGAALLDRDAPVYVRTSVLVTNLGVHFKLGAANSAVWVTTLDSAKPVADAVLVLGGALAATRPPARATLRIRQGCAARCRCGPCRCAGC